MGARSGGGAAGGIGSGARRGISLPSGFKLPSYANSSVTKVGGSTIKVVNTAMSAHSQGKIGVTVTRPNGKSTSKSFPFPGGSWQAQKPAKDLAVQWIKNGAK